MSLDVQCLHIFVRDLNLSGVVVLIKDRANAQSLCRPGTPVPVATQGLNCSGEIHRCSCGQALARVGAVARRLRDVG